MTLNRELSKASPGGSNALAKYPFPTTPGTIREPRRGRAGTHSTTCQVSEPGKVFVLTAGASQNRTQAPLRLAKGSFATASRIASEVPA